MKKKSVQFSFTVWVIYFLIALSTSSSKAHPWGGLVIDANGTIYFTFVCPLVGDDHYACVWKIDSNKELSEVLKARRSPSDLILSRTPDRKIFAAERSGFNPNFNNTLWKIETSNTSIEINTNTNQEAFFIQTYTVSNDGEIYFAKEDRVYIRSNNGTIAELELGKDLGRIGLLRFGKNGALYIMTKSTLYVIRDGILSLLASDLRKENPKNIPFQGANIFFDMTIDNNENVYLAYYGNRKVIKISPSGEAITVLESNAPWSPHGIDVFEGDLYVLESTLGSNKWWKFWQKETEILPRIRKVDPNGNVSTVFNYQTD